MRIFALLASFIFGAFAQAQLALPVKEQYDHVTHKQLYGGGTYNGVVSYMVDNVSPWNTHAFGEEVGGFLEGYLRMYETTKDKAYLIRFINLSLEALAWRNANYTFSQFELAYMDGLMARSLAHFVHLVLIEEPDLGIEVIPEDLIQYQTSTVPGNVLPYQADYTYAELAEVDQYITTHGHLPNVPSAECMVEDGLDVVSTNAMLLAKIEELTLYVLELKKELSELKGVERR